MVTEMNTDNWLRHIRVRATRPLRATRAGLCVAAVALILSAAHRIAAADDLLGDDDKTTAAVLDDMRENAGGQWWNKDWKLRRKITIEDPRALGAMGNRFSWTSPTRCCSITRDAARMERLMFA